jgi:hypothetical protein
VSCRICSAVVPFASRSFCRDRIACNYTARPRLDMSPRLAALWKKRDYERRRSGGWTREDEVRAAIRLEFGDRAEYHRPEWSRFEGRSADGRTRFPGEPRRSKPYRRIKDVLAELDERARSGGGIAALVPARTETTWAHDYCFPWEVRFLRGRVQFPGMGHSGAPFPSMVVVMGPPARPGQIFGWDLRGFGQLDLFDRERLARWPGAGPWKRAA